MHSSENGHFKRHKILKSYLGEHDIHDLGRNLLDNLVSALMIIKNYISIKSEANEIEN